MSENAIAVGGIDDLKTLVAVDECLLAVGNCTKASLSAVPEAKLVSLRSLTGIIEYEPSEFTFTARAGTTISEIDRALAEKRQYLPFDPMLVDAGATLGGSVASGLSGPGRFRYGGIRDFLLGVRFISGDGAMIKAGGKVVKNAAGFDIPKFMVGSMGRFGVLTELTFKVFPRPIATHTLCVNCASDSQAVERMAIAAASRWELDAIDYRPDERSLLLRLAGPERVNASIADEIRSRWGQDVRELPSAGEFWRAVRELDWLKQSTHAIKVPATPGQCANLTARLAHDEVKSHWSVAGNLMWVLLTAGSTLGVIDQQLKSAALPGLVVRGICDTARIGQWNSSVMESAVKRAMDPPGKFPQLI